jgi:hypothetical protein
LTVAALAVFLMTAPAALADRGGRGHSGRGDNRRHYAPQRHYNSVGFRSFYSAPRYAPVPRGIYRGSYVPGRFYSGRGYFYGDRFWARPYFGVGIGIPFGYGFRTNRGCGYVDGWGAFHPAPCYVGYDSGY